MIRRPRAHRLLTAVLAGLGLLSAGCLREKRTVTLFADGEGTIRLTSTLNATPTSILLGGAKTGAERDAAAERAAMKTLAGWSGVTAWTGVSYSVEGGSLAVSALGYFPNADKLRWSDRGNEDSFRWTKKKNGGFKFSWTSKKREIPKGPLAAKATDEDVAQVEASLGLLEGLRVEHEAVFPGKIRSCRGCASQTERGASSVVTLADVSSAAARIVDLLGRVKSGELASDEADVELRAELGALSMNLAVAVGPDQDAGAFAAFQEEFARARKEYAASGLAEKIAEAGGKRGP